MHPRGLTATAAALSLCAAATAAVDHGVEIRQLDVGTGRITTAIWSPVSGIPIAAKPLTDTSAPQLATGVGIQNGDFSAGLDGWTTAEQGGGSSPGSVTPVAEQARFAEGDSFLVTLHQTFVLTPNAAAISFDFFDLPGFDLAAAFIPDAFEASLFDASSQSLVPTWHPQATSFWNVQEDGTMLSAPGVTIQGSRVSVDVSHLVAGTEVRVQFDLIGGDSDRLGAVTIDDVAIDADGCPVFPTWEFYGEGLAGTVGVPAITVQQDPQLGTKLSLGLGNSAGAPTVAVGILSLAPDALPTTLVGTLLVSAKPSDLVGVWTLPLPADGELIGHSIPADAPLCGLSVYGQAVVQDPGAPMGWAFTRGVRFVLGG